MSVLPAPSAAPLSPATGPSTPAHPLCWDCGRRVLDLTHRGVIMGILNLTPDSFSDGGLYQKPEAALAHALAMVEAGAEILDLGGESTRPGAQPVPLEEELARVLPILRALRPRTEVLLSIDTSKAEVARQALAEGADIVNDVTALRGDPSMPEVVAAANCGIVLMHMRGTPLTMQIAPDYTDVVREVRDFLRVRAAAVEALGVKPARLCLDPGIGFGKTFAHNAELLAGLERLHLPLHGTGEDGTYPILLGVSRKSFLGAICDGAPVNERLWPGVALTSWAREKGVRIFRVHDVRENLHALRVTEAILHYA